MISIRTNYSSLNAQRNLSNTQMRLDESLSRLSSGFRITRAGDDAAGLGISVNLEAQVRSYNQAVRNANDGISLVQTAEGALNETSNILTRLRELAMQSASDGVSDTQRAYIQSETAELLAEINRIATGTKYNGTALLDGTGGTLDFQVGTGNVAAVDRISVATGDATGATLGVVGLSLATKAAAQGALATLDTAINSISNLRATFGAAGNRLNSAINTISVASENLAAANSRIRDVNVAEESSNLSRAQVLMQAGVSVLAQANSSPQAALKLLQ
jgi:flagellin